MVKRSMKVYRDSKEWAVLNRVLDHRQLALKMLANVTYGYTSATFSGRMVSHSCNSSAPMMNSLTPAPHPPRITLNVYIHVFVIQCLVNQNPCILLVKTPALINQNPCPH